ncbi:MAG TPA: hypothetical protein VGV89_10415 [Thermoplasmata archaeon]|nr:hypothetical protein [Thermoplasmata archaeon]
MSDEGHYLCERHLAPYLAGLLTQLPGREARIKLESASKSATPKMPEFLCRVCQGDSMFLVRRTLALEAE